MDRATIPNRCVGSQLYAIAVQFNVKSAIYHVRQSFPNRLVDFSLIYLFLSFDFLISKSSSKYPNEIPACFAFWIRPKRCWISADNGGRKEYCWTMRSKWDEGWKYWFYKNCLFMGILLLHARKPVSKIKPVLGVLFGVNRWLSYLKLSAYRLINLSVRRHYETFRNMSFLDFPEVWDTSTETAI